MKLSEVFTGGGSDLSYFGFHLKQEEEHEDDNSKLWHTVTFPNGKTEVLDHSPYELIDAETFKRYVLFFKEHKRFPTRQDINSIGPLNKEDVFKLTR